MRRRWFVLCCWLLAALPGIGSATEEALPPKLPAGLWLPVILWHSVAAGKTQVGTVVQARLTQRVPLGGGRYLDRNDRVLGSVVASTWNKLPGQRTGLLIVRFDSLTQHGQTVPLAAKVLAVASFVDVADTGVPLMGASDRGNPSPANWTTQQIGGDEVYRSGWTGDVCDTVMKKVGTADFAGVYTLPVTLPDGGAPLPRAAGVFSTTSLGLYGFGLVTTMESASGTMTMRSTERPVLHAGDNLLLQVETP